MARREEAWLKNYEDVEYDLPAGSGSPTEQHPMLPPKTHLKDGTGMGVEGQPHIAGVRPSASLAVQIPPNPSLAPPGTTTPIARIPRSHSAPKVFPNSPLNPTTTTTTTPSSSMPFPSPFTHPRPASRGSAYFSRIASEEARAFGSVPPSSTNPSSANHGLTSRGSMILYRVADPFSPPPSQPSANNSGANTPTSHYSLRGLVATDDGTLPLPEPSSRNNRLSIHSISGDSIVSLSSDSKYPNFESQRSGLIAYVYDPDADESLDDDDEVDWLHDPETLIAEKLVKLRNGPATHRPAYLKAPNESSLSWRGLLNITVLILLISTVLALFIAYPTVATISDEERNKMIAFNTRINSTGQAVDSDADILHGGGGTTTTSLSSLSTFSTETTDSTTTTRTTSSTPTRRPTSTTPTSTTDTETTTDTPATPAASDDPLRTQRRRGFVWDPDRKLWVTDDADNGWTVEKDSRARRSSRDFAAR